MNPTPTSFRSGYVAVVGWPNVGKSTFMNALLGAKLSIVSDRPQTTREAILGILNEPGVQMIFVDTPGWLTPKDNFQSFMKRAVVRTVYDDADVILWLAEPRPLSEEEKEFGRKLEKTGKPVLKAVNKIDLKPDPAVLDQLKAEGFTHFIAAKILQGIAPLKVELIKHLPEGTPYFPTDQMTDRWERFYVAELVREQIFKKYRDEVPHASYVHVQEFVEKEGRKDHILTHIYVETEGQKKILIGAQGRGIRELGEASRKEIEIRLGRPVYLELHVKVQKGWRGDADFIKKFGGDHF